MFYWGENIYKNIIITKQNVGSQFILFNKFSAGTDVIPSQESVFLHLIIDTMLNINSTANFSSECPLSTWTFNGCWDLMCFHSSEDVQSCWLKSKHICLLTKIFISFCFHQIWLLTFINYRIISIEWVTNKREIKRGKLSHG